MFPKPVVFQRYSFDPWPNDLGNSPCSLRGWQAATNQLSALTGWPGCLKSGVELVGFKRREMFLLFLNGGHCVLLVG